MTQLWPSDFPPVGHDSRRIPRATVRGSFPLSDKPETFSPKTLQIATLITLLGGGWVGKDAYDGIRDQLSEARVDNAAIRETLKALDARLVAHEDHPHKGAIDAVDRLEQRVRELERR